jgi:hypothetical protein
LTIDSESSAALLPLPVTLDVEITVAVADPVQVETRAVPVDPHLLNLEREAISEAKDEPSSAEEPGRPNCEIPKVADDSSPYARVTTPVIDQALEREKVSCQHPTIADDSSCKRGTNPPVYVQVLGHGEISCELPKFSDDISLEGSVNKTNRTKNVAPVKISCEHENSANDSSSRKMMNPRDHTLIVSPVITPYRTVTSSRGQAASRKPYRTADVDPLKTRPGQSAIYSPPDQTINLNPTSRTMSIATVILKLVHFANPAVATSGVERNPNMKTENGTRENGK